MAMATATALAILAATAGPTAATAASVRGSRAQSRAGRQAAKYTEAAGSQATRQENDAETRRREEYDREQAEARRQWDAQQAQLLEDRRIAEEERQRQHQLDAEDRRIAAEERGRAEEDRQRNIAAWNEREARMAPYRQAGAGALSELQRLAGQTGAPASSGPRPMPEGWTPNQASAAPPVSDLPTTTSRTSMTDYASSLPVTRNPSIAQELGEDPDQMAEEPIGGSLSSMRQPTEDVGYLLDNPSQVSPEAYRRLVLSQGGERDPNAMPLSLMRQPGLWNRSRRPPRRMEARP